MTGPLPPEGQDPRKPEASSAPDSGRKACAGWGQEPKGGRQRLTYFLRSSSLIREEPTVGPNSQLIQGQKNT